jgi:hypothetical protein
MMADEKVFRPESRPSRESDIIERGRTTPDRPVQQPARTTTTSPTDKKD